MQAKDEIILQQKEQIQVLEEKEKLRPESCEDNLNILSNEVKCLDQYCLTPEVKESIDTETPPSTLSQSPNTKKVVNNYTYSNVEVQTEQVHTQDYLFFQNMVEDYLKECLLSNNFSDV